MTSDDATLQIRSFREDLAVGEHHRALGSGSAKRAAFGLIVNNQDFGRSGLHDSARQTSPDPIVPHPSDGILIGSIHVRLENSGRRRETDLIFFQSQSEAGTPLVA